MKSEGLLQRSVQFLGHSVFTGFLLNGFVLTCITEAFNRQSVAGMLRFMAGSPLAFLCNMFIISLTLCLSLLVVHRRYFVQAFISLVWIVMGAANCIILTYRMTPFSAEDFSLLPMLARIESVVAPSPRYAKDQLNEDSTQMMTADSKIRVPAFLTNAQDFSVVEVRTLRGMGA